MSKLEPSALAILAAEVKDDLDLDAFVRGLDPALVPVAVLRTRELRKRLQDIEGRLETRLIEDKVTAWTDPDSGDEYDMKGDGRWEYDNPEGLMLELAQMGVAQKDLDAAFRHKLEPLTIEINRLCAVYPSIQTTVDNFRTRKYGPRHLVKREGRR